LTTVLTGCQESGSEATATPTAGEIQQAPAVTNTAEPTVTATPTLPPATGTPPPTLTPTMTPCPTPVTAVATPAQTPTPTPTIPPSPTRPAIAFEPWEQQLMSIVVFFEVEGQGLAQAEAVIWIILNRFADTRFPALPGYTSRLESLLLADPQQFHISPGIFRHWTEQGITGQRRAELAYDFYSTSPDYNGAGLRQVNEFVPQVIASYSSGGKDPTEGAIYFMHTDPGREESSIAHLRAVAEREERLDELRVGYILGESAWRPRVLVYNNLYSP
jgi:hypothetical protein